MSGGEWRRYDRDALDSQYSPSRTAKDFAGAIERYGRDTERAKRRLAATALLDVAYGSAPRQRLDVYPARAEARPSPVHLFIHGGFWQLLSKDYAGFPAPAFVDAGSAFVAVGYTLAPAATLPDIVGEVAAATRWVVREAESFGADPTRLVVSGHSAGAYLAASLVTPVADLGADALAAIRGLVLIGGVYDLAPVAASYVNDQLALKPEDVESLDLVRTRPLRDVVVRVAVGDEEPDEFKRQTALLVNAWRPAVSDLQQVEAQGRDHFDLLFDLADPAGSLFRTAVALSGTSGAPESGSR
jgi:arylformamidase